MTIVLQSINALVRGACRNAPVPRLYELALAAGDAQLAQGGSLVVSTGTHTGRSPKDRFIVDQPATSQTVDWNEINQPIEQVDADRLRDAVIAYLGERNCFVQDLDAGADPLHRLPIRIVTPSAWHALFAETMFVRPSSAERAQQEPAFTVLHAPDFEPDPAEFGLRTSTFIVVDISAGTILIGGTQYAGEIKKSIFSVMNFSCPNAAFSRCIAPAMPEQTGCRSLLRTLRHGQDHALGRSKSHSDRRRRTWLERQRCVQLRGRMLRQGNLPQRRSRARDLRDHAHVWHHPGKCSCSIPIRV
ncbi:MAG: phosphoenolpyruvate carboxykinase (ATP) [Thermomicrobiales bacterium]